MDSFDLVYRESRLLAGPLQDTSKKQFQYELNIYEYKINKLSSEWITLSLLEDYRYFFFNFQHFNA